jgi:hypothetical protein
MRLSNPELPLLPVIVPVLFVGLFPLVILPLVSFLGVAFIGLLIGLAAIMVQLEEAGSHAQRTVAQHGPTRAEHAGYGSEMRSLMRQLYYARIVSVGLIVIGCGGFLLFQRG